MDASVLKSGCQNRTARGPLAKPAIYLARRDRPTYPTQAPAGSACRTSAEELRPRHVRRRGVAARLQRGHSRCGDNESARRKRCARSRLTRPPSPWQARQVSLCEGSFSSLIGRAGLDAGMRRGYAGMGYAELSIQTGIRTSSEAKLIGRREAPQRVLCLGMPESLARCTLFRADGII